VIFSVRHVTTFRYEPAVRESLMEVRMQPRSEAQQRCLSFHLEVEPSAQILQYRDFLGNTVHHFDIAGSHKEVRLTAQAIVELQDTTFPSAGEAGDFQDLDAIIAAGDHWEMLLPSRYACFTPELNKLAHDLRLERKGNPLELVLRINQGVYDAFEYVPNSTKVDSPIDDALRTRQGVCQDFAHIMIALLRQLRIPSRYVSGYLYHGNHIEDRSPESASHAWAETLLPGLGWVAFDPTNNLAGSERHLRVALGRDYADVPPTRGVYKGEAASELSVLVTVAPSDAPLPEELPPAFVVRARPDSRVIDFRQEHEQQQQ
jgi:transglutaminase-like putative cysteine protease